MAESRREEEKPTPLREAWAFPCWLLVHLRKLHQEAAVAGLDGRQSAVPAVDESLLVFDLAEIQKLRRQDGLGLVCGGKTELR